MSDKEKIVKTQLIRSILKERDIEQTEPEFVKSNSNGRTIMIKELSIDELDKILLALNTFTFEYLLEGLYKVAFGLGIIKDEESNLINDELILKFMQTDLMFDIPIKQQSYLSVYKIVNKLGEIFMAKSSALN